MYSISTMEYKCAVLYSEANTTVVSYAKKLIIKMKDEWQMPVFDVNDDVPLGQSLLPVAHDAATKSEYCLYVYSPSPSGNDGDAWEKFRSHMAMITQLFANRMDRFLPVAIGFASEKEARLAYKACFSSHKIIHVESNDEMQSFQKILEVLTKVYDNVLYAMATGNDNTGTNFDPNNGLTNDRDTIISASSIRILAEQIDTVLQSVKMFQQSVDNLVEVVNDMKRQLLTLTEQQNRPSSLPLSSDASNLATGKPKTTSRNKLITVSSVVLGFALGSFFVVKSFKRL